MLGSDVCKVLGAQREIVPFDIDDFDIVDSTSAQQRISESRPDLVIHCAAYTDVDRAEREQERVFDVNERGTKNVALVSQQLNIPMVYMSTDYVFDGEKNSPYREGDPPNPLNQYGRSKLAGEEWVKRLLKKFFIVRTSGLYGENGDSFIHRIVRAASSSRYSCTPQGSANQSELKVVDDQVGNPTYTVDLAEALNLLIESQCYGIYHITNSGFCSWYQFAKKVFEILGREVRLKAVDSVSLHQTAKRPRFSALENFAWANTSEKKLRHWEDALKDFLSSTSGVKGAHQ